LPRGIGSLLKEDRALERGAESPGFGVQAADLQNGGLRYPVRAELNGFSLSGLSVSRRRPLTLGVAQGCVRTALRACKCRSSGFDCGLPTAGRAALPRSERQLQAKLDFALRVDAGDLAERGIRDRRIDVGSGAIVERWMVQEIEEIRPELVV
jgi:hypothetical protein